MAMKSQNVIPGGQTTIVKIAEILGVDVPTMEA